MLIPLRIYVDPGQGQIQDFRKGGAYAFARRPDAVSAAFDCIFFFLFREQRFKKNVMAPIPVLTVILNIHVMIEWYLYVWKNLKCDNPCFQNFLGSNLNFRKDWIKCLFAVWSCENKQLLKKEDQFNGKLYMENFTLAAVNAVNEKCVNWSRAIKNFPKSKHLSPWPFRTGQPLLSWWGGVSLFISIKLWPIIPK